MDDWFNFGHVLPCLSIRAVACFVTGTVAGQGGSDFFQALGHVAARRSERFKLRLGSQEIQIKGPENPTCQLLPISYNKSSSGMGKER